MADVEVVFGARIDQLTNAVQEVKTQLVGLNSSVSGLMGSFGKLGEAVTFVTGTLAAFGLEEFARKMADSGVAMDRLKTALGVNSEQMLTIKAAAELAGVPVEGLAMSIERMSLIVQRSTRDALGPQAQALKVLGLNAQDLIGLSADQYFLKVAEASSKFNPSLNLTNALMTVGGRSMAQMVAAFAHGTDEVKKFTEDMKRTKTGLEGFGPAAEVTHRNLALMDSASSALAKQLFVNLAPALNVIIKNSTEFANSIRDSVKAGGAWGIVMDGIAASLKVVVTALSGMTAALKFVTAEARALWNAFTVDGEDARRKIGEELKTDLAELVSTFRKTFDELWGPTKITVHGRGGLLDAAQIDEQARKSLEMTMKAIDGQIALVEEGFNRQKVIYERDVLNLQVTEGQKISLVSVAAQQRYAAEVSLLQQKLSLSGLDVAQRQEIENKITEMVQKALTDRLKMQNDYTKEVQSQWDSVMGTIQRSWDSQLRGLLTHTTTWAAAMRNIFLDLVLAIISEFEKLAIVKPLVTALSTAFEPASLFANIAKSVTKMIGEVFAGATAFFAPTLGPAAPAAGAAVAAATQVAAAEYDVGSWNVPATAMAMVHQGEMIIPQQQASVIRESGGLGHTVNINISAMDAGSFHAAMRSGMGDAITRHVSRALQANPSMRPGYTT